MKRTFPTALIAIIIGALAFDCAAQTPSIEQSLNLKSASAPSISPDGRFVAYHVQRTNWEENAFETELWIADTSTGERYQLTNSKKSNTALFLELGHQRRRRAINSPTVRSRTPVRNGLPIQNESRSYQIATVRGRFT
jgi:dipeptidyl aminopeptidase/acylaminoacyl peptidase